MVLTHEEAMQIIDRLGKTDRLIASLLYGSGLRVTEACRLRIKDLDLMAVAVPLSHAQHG